MRRVPVYLYYAFGYNYYRLRFHTLGDENSHARNQVAKFLRHILDLELRVTVQAAKEIRQIAEDLEKLPPDAQIDDDMSTRIQEACSRIDRTLDAELQLLGAYAPTSKRFALVNLIESLETLFAQGTFKSLSELCKYDFAEACKCIAFERPTAAVFHLMRGTEGVLREYYKSIIKRGRKKDATWHQMLADLRKRRDSPPAGILDHLDNIRANFRNPTQHPEARYEIDEAQDLLAVSTDVVNRIYRDMKKRLL